MILKLIKKINRKVRSELKFVRMLCDIDIVEQYKACYPCHFYYIDNCVILVISFLTLN